MNFFQNNLLNFENGTQKDTKTNNYILLTNDVFNLVQTKFFWGGESLMSTWMSENWGQYVNGCTVAFVNCDPKFFFKKNGPTPAYFFAYFCSFQTQILEKKLLASTGFEIGLPELKASMLTI